MYLNENVRKQNEKIFAYNLSHGLENADGGAMGKIVGAKNVSFGKNGQISSVSKRIKKAYPNNAISVGAYGDKLYYNTPDGFYYDGIKRGELSEGEKLFVLFQHTVFVFPDGVYYDIRGDVFDYFHIETRATLRIGPASGRDDFEMYSLRGEVNPAEIFGKAKSITILGSSKGIYDGAHKINRWDTTNGRLYFGARETGADYPVSDTSVLINTGVPLIENACVCQNRIFGCAEDTVYACALGDATNWCDYAEPNGHGSYKYKYLGADDFFGCGAVDDMCVLFASDKILKLYGENTLEYSPRLVFDGSGIAEKLSGALSKARGKIYYLDKNYICCFSGILSEKKCKFCDGEVLSATMFTCADKIYIRYLAVDGWGLCVYCTETETLARLEDIPEMKGFFTLFGNACVLTDSEIISLGIDGDALPNEFNSCENLESTIEFDEIYNGAEMLSPSRLCIRAQLSAESELSAYCMAGDCGEWVRVCKINGAGSGLYEFNMPSAKADSLRLKLCGSGDYVIKNIYIKYS